MFDLIFQREEGLDILGVPDYSKVVSAICENTKLFDKAACFSDFWQCGKQKSDKTRLFPNRKSRIIFSSTEAPETVSPHYE